MSNNTYSPDRWVAVQFQSPNGTFTRVLAGWSGSWAHGASYKLSSAVERVEHSENHYTFYCNSGSNYHCRKTAYGFNVLTAQVLAEIESTVAESTEPYNVTLETSYEPDRTN